MIIRNADTANLDELHAIGALTATVYVGEGFVGADADYADELRDAFSRAHDAELLVAVDERDGRLLGTVTYCWNTSPYSEVADPGEADFRMLAVDQTARGRGVGEALVRACLDRARAAGATAIRLSSKDEMHAAHRLYKRLDFYRTPERDWGPEADLTLLTFARDLPAGQ